MFYINVNIGVFLRYSRHGEGESVVVWELLAADIEGIESVGAVGAVFEQVFLGFGEFLPGFVLAESQTATAHSGRLNGKYQIVVVLTVEERHKPLFTCEALIDEQVFFIVSHRVAEIHVLDAPPVPLELVDNDPSEILLVDGIVASQRRTVVIEYHGLVLV